jgi:alkanesulfonate monooxygenase SsuD/methylene tetrahydromethanopterin reductase-like flavin-dependent oxidoreductase (luciferase family)
MKIAPLIVPATLIGEDEKFQDLIDMVVLTETLGMDGVWLTEHHFSEYGRPSVPAIAGYLAAKTEKININIGVSVLPFHHPIEVAEDWATIDHLTGGRVNFGIGRGNQPHEFAGFNMPMDEARERFNESLDIIIQAWTQESIEYKGKFWDIPKIQVVPKPKQKPHPPIYQAALSDYTVSMVIDKGINGLIGPYLTEFDILKEKYFGVWHRLCKEKGKTNLKMAHNQFIYVSDSNESAYKEAKESVMWYVNKASRLWGDPNSDVKQYKNYGPIVQKLADTDWDYVYENLIICGGPDLVIEKVNWLKREGGLDELIPFFWFGGMTKEQVMRNMEMFAEKVMPHIR